VQPHYYVAEIFVFVCDGGHTTRGGMKSASFSKRSGRKPRSCSLDWNARITRWTAPIAPGLSLAPFRSSRLPE
jgi:hypothetical protein